MTTTESTASAATTLGQQLAEFKSGFKQRATAQRVALMEAATADLKATGIEARALKVGDAAPDLTLPDALNQPVRLADLWQRGALVLVFYRGGWCPYCNLELRAWQQHLDGLTRSGASLVAVSPQTPDNSLSTAEKGALAYPVLSDSKLAAATAFGVAFEMPPDLIDLYRSVGNDLPAVNGNGRWVLPVPATYVIGRDGRIVFAHVEADYRERAEPADVIAAVEHARGTESMPPSTVGQRSRTDRAELTPSLQAQVDQLAAALRAKAWRIATAESCTGGLIAAACTSVAGSSDWFERGFVTYSNEAKTELIGVPAVLIAQHGAVSEAVARAMAEGALAHSRAQLAVAVTGIAGPGGAVPGKPVGTVWLALASTAGMRAELLQLQGDRAAVRAQTVEHALRALLAAAQTA